MRFAPFALAPAPDASASWGACQAFVCLVALVIAIAPLAARADDDLPGRVGRIADFGGQVFLSPPDRATEWSVVGINYPVTSGDNLYVSVEGRAEIDYGGGQFRLAGDTNLNVSRLDDRQLALFIAQGRLVVRVRVLDSGEAARVDTPNTQVTLTRPGLYRIDVTADGQRTTTSVREGEALIALTSGAQQALPGQSVTVAGPEPAYADLRQGAGIDGFDSWSADRDRRYERGVSSAYVSRQMVGYADLDDYGTWTSVPTYGPVWYPSAVAADWAPYRDGYWTSVGGWGLTWVDAAPWGYAPSHYGRWVHVGGRWGWCPGAYVARPYWAPALVAWYGGAGWGLSGSARAPVYGWVPLGWGDPYLPWWRRCSNNCWSHYNRPYAVNVNVRPTRPPARYTNSEVPGAMTAVPGSALGNRRPVPGSIVPMPGSAVASAPVLAGAPAVAPGPLHTPALRPGERGTPTPASMLNTGASSGRNAAAPAPRTGGSSTVPGSAGGAVIPPRGGASGAPSGFALTPGPAARLAPPAVQAPLPPDGAAAVRPSGATSTPQATVPLPQTRRAAPPPATPEAGGTIVAAPPARGDTRQQAQQPKLMGPSGQAVAPPAQQQGYGRPGSPGPAGPSGQSAASQAVAPPVQQQGYGRPGNPAPAGPATPIPAASGLALPPPRSVPAAPSAAPMVAPSAAPVVRPAPAPSTGQPVYAPVAPVAPVAPAAPQDRSQAKPPDARAGSGKTGDKDAPVGGAASR